MIYYAIRHKLTNELMPQAKRDKGYSHWNPNCPSHKFESAMGVPRLIDTRRKAAKCIVQWAANPNGINSISQNSYTGEVDDIVDTKPDGRHKDDLEVVEIELIVKE